MRNKIESEDTVDARKQTMGKKEALDLARSVKTIYACKGSKLTEIDMAKDKPGDEEILEALLGPTGNLRAPTMKFGDRLLVGFNEDLFKSILKTPVGTRA